MWIAEHWRDYELIDCAECERLERWGEQILIRPEQQIPPSMRRSSDNRWVRFNGCYAADRAGQGHWRQNDLPESWTISYGPLTFLISTLSFKHTGLFPEQAANWEFARRQIQNAGRPIRVLNLFAYTGGATLACAAAGASVCHVDASKGMVARARENARLSHLENAPIRWIVDDCGKFVKREIRRGRKYDALILDPPAYGHGPSGERWSIGKDLRPFLEQAVQLLSDAPLFIIINSYTTWFLADMLKELLKDVVQSRYGGHADVQELGLPITKKDNMVLPCGTTGRWSSTKTEI